MNPPSRFFRCSPTQALPAHLRQWQHPKYHLFHFWPRASAPVFLFYQSFQASHSFQERNQYFYGGLPPPFPVHSYPACTFPLFPPPLSTLPGLGLRAEEETAAFLPSPSSCLFFHVMCPSPPYPRPAKGYPPGPPFPPQLSRCVTGPPHYFFLQPQSRRRWWNFCL